MPKPFATPRFAPGQMVKLRHKVTSRGRAPGDCVTVLEVLPHCSWGDRTWPRYAVEVDGDPTPLLLDEMALSPAGEEKQPNAGSLFADADGLPD